MPGTTVNDVMMAVLNLAVQRYLEAKKDPGLSGPATTLALLSIAILILVQEDSGLLAWPLFADVLCVCLCVHVVGV
eukprot:3810345-Rhodomonas_salina.1